MITIEVKRIRQSVTQGEAAVYINGKHIITFGDTIVMPEPGETYYGEKIGNWASIQPDSTFISGALWHELGGIYYCSDAVRNAIAEANTPKREPQKGDAK